MWEQRFPAGSEAACNQAAGWAADSEGYKFALEFQGAHLCVSQGIAEVFAFRVASFVVLWDSNVPYDQALQTVRQVLDRDYAQVAEADGTTPKWSTLTGTCHQVEFNSPTLGALESRLEWKELSGSATAVFYSGDADFDGSHATFDGTVHQVLVSSGKIIPLPKGVGVTC